MRILIFKCAMPVFGPYVCDKIMAVILKNKNNIIEKI